MSSIQIRSATIEDVPLILQFIKKLAAYHDLEHDVDATEESLTQNLFGEKRYAEVIFAYAQKSPESPFVPAGFALYFHNFSTFRGRPGLYLEDLYAEPEFRGMGVGKKLLTHLAAIAKERGCARYEWICLDTNTPSRKFYESFGAKPQTEWIIHRVSGEPLDKLATL